MAQEEIMETKKEVALTGGFSLTPKTFEEAERFAKLMADSDMVPTAYKGKPGNVLVAVQMGAELGIKPLQSLQNIAVINGKPSIYGDLGTAILRAAGCEIALDDIQVIKTNKRARCIITRPGGEKIERTFGQDDAERAGLWGKAGPWTTYTWRQMGWRAFWFAARDGAADFLKGLRGAEEMLDAPPEVIEAVVVTDDGPKRKSETAGAPIAPAPAPEPQAPPPAKAAPEVVEYTAKGKVSAITVKEVGGVKEFTVTVEDEEGLAISVTRELAAAEGLKKLKEEGKDARVFFKIVGARNELVRFEPA